jgi:di/tricarboxylate transporter
LALALSIFSAAIIFTSTGMLPVQIALMAAAALMVVLGLLSLNEAYQSIDWPILVLLGAMMPVGTALETTGSAQLLADQVLYAGRSLPPALTLTVVLSAAMLLSNVINNAAAAVLMAPIAISVARGLEVSVDPFLIAVAVGSSCAFLTPIGHQSNTLVMGPGGYRFGDYWRMGLPLSLVVILAAVPLILLVWPL